MKKVLVSASVTALVAALNIATPSTAQQPAPTTPTVSTAEQKKIDPNQTIARVGNQTLRLLDVEEVIKRLPRELLQNIPLENLYPQILEEMILRLAVVKKAKEKKLDHTLEYKKLKHELEEDLLYRIYLSKDRKKAFTEDELKQTYDEYLKNFLPEDQIRIRHILVKDKTKAEEIIKKLQDGADFAKLAAEDSLDKDTAAKGGEIGFITRNQIHPTLAKAAFEIKDKEHTKEPVQSSHGFHILRREETRKTAPESYETAKAHLLPKYLEGKETQARFKAALQGLKIERFNLDGTPLTIAPNNAQLQAPAPQQAVPLTNDTNKANTPTTQGTGADAGKHIGEQLKK